MASAGKPLDLEITVISAKHLHNVNWRNGDLKPYVVFYLDSDRRLATHSDDSGSTCSVWNERYTLPITSAIQDAVLTVEVLHSKFSETLKPIVGSLKFPLSCLLDSADSNSVDSVRSLELFRPSGRPQGKIRLKLALKERLQPDYYDTVRERYSYTTAGARDFRDREFSYPYGYSESLYYSSSAIPSRPTYNRPSSYASPSSPSAPVDLSTSDDHKPPPAPASSYGGPSAPGVDYSVYNQKLPKGSEGLILEEGNNYEQGKVAERLQGDLAAREGYAYADYHHYH